MKRALLIAIALSLASTSCSDPFAPKLTCIKSTHADTLSALHSVGITAYRDSVCSVSR